MDDNIFGNYTHDKNDVVRDKVTAEEFMKGELNNRARKIDNILKELEKDEALYRYYLFKSSFKMHIAMPLFMLPLVGGSMLGAYTDHFYLGIGTGMTTSIGGAFLYLYKIHPNLKSTKRNTGLAIEKYNDIKAKKEKLLDLNYAYRE